MVVPSAITLDLNSAAVALAIIAIEIANSVTAPISVA